MFGATPEAPVALFGLGSGEITGTVAPAGGEYAINYASTGSMFESSGSTGGENHAPVTGTELAGQTFQEGDSISVQLPDGAFSDPDGDALSYSAKLADGSMLPTWLQFNSATRTFTGTPDDAQVGTLSIMVTAADAGASVNQTFDLTVTNVNDAPGGGVSAVGTPAEDQTMVADTTSIADADGLGAMSYQWARSSDGGATWSDISGANGASYTLGDSDVGSQVHVNVSYTDGHGTAESLTSAASAVVANVNDAPGGAVSVAGMASEDHTLTADVSSVTDIDGLGSMSYQWARSSDGGATWNDISGANGASYTLGDSDVGSQVHVNMSYTDGHGTAESLASAASDVVANVNDAPTVANPVGDLQVDEDSDFALDISGVFADVDMNDGLNLSVDAPSWLTYSNGELWGTPGNAEVGTYSVTLTATDGAGESDHHTFAITVNNVNDAPTVAHPVDNQHADEDSAFSVNLGNVFADVDLHDSLSLTVDAPAWLTYNSDTGELSGTPGEAAVGTHAVTMTATDKAGESVQQTFSITVANVNDAPSGAVSVVGTVREDQTLTANTSSVGDADGLGTFTYQWARSSDGGVTWQSINGATGATYKLGDNDVNSQVRVGVSYTDGHGTAESMTSAATGPVTNVNDAPSGSVGLVGTASENQTLTASTSGIGDADGLGTFTYQWARSTDGGATWSNISGATGSSYALGDSDVGSRVRANVRYTDGQGTAESLTSAASAVVANVNDAPTGAVSLAGTAAEDQILTANTSGIGDADGLGTFSYQWARSTDGGATWSAVSGATGASYALGDTDVGSRMRVNVSYTDGHGTVESLTSAASAAVANVNDAPELMQAIADQNAMAGQAYSWTVPAAAFRDVDTGDTLTYSMRMADGSALPSWLTFDPNTRKLSGTPAGVPSNARLSMQLQVVATDRDGLDGERYLRPQRGRPDPAAPAGAGQEPAWRQRQ